MTALSARQQPWFVRQTERRPWAPARHKALLLSCGRHRSRRIERTGPSTGGGVWACAPNPPSVDVSAPTAIAASIRYFVIDQTPSLNFLRQRWRLPCLLIRTQRPKVTADHDVVRPITNGAGDLSAFS